MSPAVPISKPTASEPLVQRKASVPAPITIPSPNQQEEVAGSLLTSDFLDRPTGGPLTPMLTSTGQGFIDPELSLIALDEDAVVDDCHKTGCSKGGLHMADHKQMIAFAKRVSRLRFHSQCANATGELNTLPSPGTSPSSTSSSLQFKARGLKRSFSLPNIQKAIVFEAVAELNKSIDTGMMSLFYSLTELGKLKKK